MKFYKVYAQCVRATKAIQEITLTDAENLIVDAVYAMVDMGDIIIEDDYEDCPDMFYDFLVDMAIKFFNYNGYFECGDFAVMKSDNEPSRDNKYGYTVDFF